ncbi:hypothetical protein, partial [Nocardioides sp. Soil796]
MAGRASFPLCWSICDSL